MYYPQDQNMWHGMGHPNQGQMYAQMQGMMPGYAQGPILVDGCDEPLMPEHAIQIYALRSRATSGTSPMELAAAGRSAVVAEMYKVSSKTVKNIWTRKCWTDATAPYWTEHETLMYECDKVKSSETPEVQSPATPVSRQSSFSSNTSFSNSFNGRAKLGGSFKSKNAGSFRGRRRHSTELVVACSRSQSPESRALSDHGGSKRNLMDLVGLEDWGAPASKRRASVSPKEDDDCGPIDEGAANFGEKRQEPTNSVAVQHDPQTLTGMNASAMANATAGITGIAVSPMEFSVGSSPSATMSRVGSGDGVVRSSSRSLPPVCKDGDEDKLKDKDQFSHTSVSGVDAGFKPVPSVVSSSCSISDEPSGETIETPGEMEETRVESGPGELRTWSSEGGAMVRSASDMSTASDANFFRTISSALKRTASKMVDVSRTSSLASLWNRTLSTASNTSVSTASPAAAFPLNLNEGGIARGHSIAERVDMLLDEQSTRRESISDEEFEPNPDRHDDDDDDLLDEPVQRRAMPMHI